MAERENVVSTDMALASATMRSARPRPAEPTTKPSRMKRMIPKMVKMLGVKTPANVPSFPVAGRERALFDEMIAAGVIADFREPCIIRITLTAFGAVRHEFTGY